LGNRWLGSRNWATLYSRAQEFDETKRQEIYAETQSIAQEYLPYIYSVNPLSIAAIRDRIQGVKYSALGSLSGTLWNKYELKVQDD
jgi:peptide/nickel transport system substrate-binding protein